MSNQSEKPMEAKSTAHRVLYDMIFAASKVFPSPLRKKCKQRILGALFNKEEVDLSLLGGKFEDDRRALEELLKKDLSCWKLTEGL